MSPPDWGSLRPILPYRKFSGVTDPIFGGCAFQNPDIDTFIGLLKIHKDSFTEEVHKCLFVLAAKIYQKNRNLAEIIFIRQFIPSFRLDASEGLIDYSDEIRYSRQKINNLLEYDLFIPEYSLQDKSPEPVKKYFTFTSMSFSQGKTSYSNAEFDDLKNALLIADKFFARYNQFTEYYKKNGLWFIEQARKKEILSSEQSMLNRNDLIVLMYLSNATGTEIPLFSETMDFWDHCKMMGNFLVDFLNGNKSSDEVSEMLEHGIINDILIINPALYWEGRLKEYEKDPLIFKLMAEYNELEARYNGQ